VVESQEKNRYCKNKKLLLAAKKKIKKKRKNGKRMVD
jgi:hypothetical protein